MAYVTLQEVRDNLPQLRIDATSKPSEGQVDAFIVAVEGYVNSALKGIGYTTPITAPASIPIVKELVMHGVVARTLRATNLGVRDPEASGSASSQREFDRMVENILDPSHPLTLPDSPVEKSGLYAGQTESHVRGLGLDPTEEPAFVRGQVF